MAKLFIINDLLKKKNMTAKELCEKVHISTTALAGAIKRGSTKIVILEDIAKVLEAPMHVFFDEPAPDANSVPFQKYSELQDQYISLLQESQAEYKKASEAKQEKDTL